MNKFMFQKVVACILDQLNKSEEDTPGMGPDHNQTH